MNKDQLNELIPHTDSLTTKNEKIDIHDIFENNPEHSFQNFNNLANGIMNHQHRKYNLKIILIISIILFGSLLILTMFSGSFYESIINKEKKQAEYVNKTLHNSDNTEYTSVVKHSVTPMTLWDEHTYANIFKVMALRDGIIIRCNGTAYDEAGNIVNTAVGYSSYTKGNTENVINVDFTFDEPVDIDKLHFEFSWLSLDNSSIKYAIVNSYNISENKLFVQLEGTIHEYIHVTALFFDGNGKLICARYGTTDPVSLIAELDLHNIPKYSSYEVYIG